MAGRAVVQASDTATVGWSRICTDLERLLVVTRKDTTLADDAPRAFLDGHTAGAGSTGDTPAWYDELGFFSAATMLLRIERLLRRPKQQQQQQLDEGPFVELRTRSGSSALCLSAG